MACGRIVKGGCEPSEGRGHRRERSSLLSRARATHRPTQNRVLVLAESVDLGPRPPSADSDQPVIDSRDRAKH